jgi:hypothetical protein
MRLMKWCCRRFVSTLKSYITILEGKVRCPILFSGTLFESRILACLAATEMGAAEIVASDGVAVLCDFLTGPAAPRLYLTSGGASMADASVAAAVVIANLCRLQPDALQAEDHAASCPPVIAALMLMMCREQRCAASTAAATVAATALAELTRGCERVCSQVCAMGGADMLLSQLQGDDNPPVACKSSEGNDNPYIAQRFRSCLFGY